MSLILRPPTGRFAVGTLSVTLPVQRIALQLWYPALHEAGGARARYRSGEQTTFRTAVLRALVRTQARVGIPVAAGSHPVLLYAPSWGGGRGENSILSQSLASHGYVVAAHDDLERSRPMDFSSSAAVADTQRRASDKAVRAALRSIGVLTELFELDAAHPAAMVIGSIDCGRIGIFGYSFGGAVAAETARCDTRIRAAANLDGWMFAGSAADGVPKPFIVIGTGEPDLPSSRVRAVRRSAPRAPGPDAAFDALNERQIVAGFERYGGYFVCLDGSRHASFCDVALLPSLRPSAAAGPLGGRRAQRIVSTYLLQFFDQFVRGHDMPLFAPQVPVPGGGARASIDPAIALKFWRDPRSQRASE